MLVRIRRPRRVLEIGTSYGYAACALGRIAAEYGGHVVTFELAPALAEAARENVRALGLYRTVEVRCEDARDALPRFDRPFGLILQDGNKDDYLPTLEPLVNLLEPGGVLVSDDVLFPVMNLPASVEGWKQAVHEYNRALCKSSRPAHGLAANRGRCSHERQTLTFRGYSVISIEIPRRLRMRKIPVE